VEQQVVAEEKTYRLGRAGRRMAYLLLAGGGLIWLFALWMLKSTLSIGVRNFWPSVKLLVKRIIGAEGTQPLSAEEAIPAIIMLVLVIVVPLLIWNILEELKSSYTVGPAGITFRSLLRVELAYPWSEVAALRPVDEESEEPLDELVVRTSRLASIRNGLARFLHWQAYGRHKLPLYGGLEERDDLIARIRAHIAAAEEAAPPAEAGEAEAAPGAGEVPTAAEAPGSPAAAEAPAVDRLEEAATPAEPGERAETV
jgi:hypothetical protein